MKVHEALCSIRKMNTTVSKQLLKRYGSLKEIILMKDYDEILNIDGVGSSKIDALTICFKGPFTIK